MYRSYNPNPTGRNVGDCTVRAVAKALDMEWEDAYLALCMQGLRMGDMPSSNAVWGAYLKGKGFTRETMGNACPDCYTLEEFAVEHPRGVFVVALSGHVATVKDGTLFDSWDSSQEIPIYVWVKGSGE